MNWTFDQLSAFVTAVNEGSFSAAARKMGKAQSRVSTAVANLEVDLGFELFDRTGHVPVLTPKGKKLLAQAEAILYQCQKLDSKAQAMANHEVTELIIAVDEIMPFIVLPHVMANGSIPFSSVPQVFAELAEAFPLIRITNITGPAEDVVNWVEEGRADFGVIVHPDSPSPLVEFTPFSQLEYQLIVHKAHPLASTESPTIGDLIQHRQIMICGANGKTRETPISPDYWQMDNFYSIFELVCRGVGWAVMPSHIVNELKLRGEFICLDTRHVPIADPKRVGIAQHREKKQSKPQLFIIERFEKLLAND